MLTVPIRWSAVITGSIASALVYFLLCSGLSVLGGEHPMVLMLWPVSDPHARVGLGDSVGLIFVIALSLLVGGYLAGRLLGTLSRSGSVVHGLLVAAVFCLLSLHPLLPPPAVDPLERTVAPSTLSLSATGLDQMAIYLGTGSIALRIRFEVLRAVTEALRGPGYPDTLPQAANRVFTLLRQRDVVGVRNYLGTQGLSPAETERRATLASRAHDEEQAKAESSARFTIAFVSLTLVFAILLGSACSVLGAVLGGRREREEKREASERVPHAA